MAKKIKSIADKALETLQPIEGDLVSTPLTKGELQTPHRVQTLQDIRREIERVYRMVYKGKLHVSEATKLVYILDKLNKSLETEATVKELNKQYATAWNGVNIKGVPDDKR